VSTADFPVAIYSLEDNKEFAYYEKASLVPNKILMSVGNYYAEAHTPGKIEKIMSTPYYAGRDTFQILQNINTVSTAMCRMANGSFEVKFSDTFHEVFKAWNIMINDGTETAIAYSATDVLPLPKRYMRFEDKTSEIFVNFVGVTNEGSRITMSNTLTKEQASEQYDDDNPNFSGGDAIVLNFTPVESTEGDITGITLKADIQFEESEITYPLEVEEKGTNGEEEGGDNPGEGGDTPGGENSGDENAITLNLPKDMTVSVSTDPALGDTYIASEHGLKSIKVKMSSTSDEMISSLQDLSRNYNGVDFINGAEVVGNDEMIRLFSDLGQTLAIPSQGDKEYTFPIGNFFTLLAFLPGEHTFTLTITDMQGNTKDGLLKLAVE
jgi:hypothetical protein